MRDLLRRPWILMLVCCVPTVLVTAAVAYNVGVASGAAPQAALAPVAAHETAVATAGNAGTTAGNAGTASVSPPSNAETLSTVPRVVAQPMLPGAQAADSGGIAAVVSYAGEVASLPSSATVFVFARRAGVPMPVAVERYQPAQLPVEVVFRAPDETGAPLQITARLSLGGGVRLEAGDVEASSEPMVPGAEESRVELRIPSL